MESDCHRRKRGQGCPELPRTQSRAEHSASRGRELEGSKAAFIQSSLKYHLSERGRLEVRILEGKFQI